MGRSATIGGSRGFQAPVGCAKSTRRGATFAGGDVANVAPRRVLHPRHRGLKPTATRIWSLRDFLTKPAALFQTHNGLVVSERWYEAEFDDVVEPLI